MPDSIIKRTVEVFRQGGVVIFPTDTVWGVGVAVNRLDAIKRLYAIKKREKRKATAILVGDFQMASEYGVFRGKAKMLAEKYWPGGLTIIVPARQGKVLKAINSGTSKIGLRIPEHEFVIKVLEKLRVGIVAGSANFAGDPAPQSFGEIDKDLIKIVDHVVRPDKDRVNKKLYEAGGKLPSTVIDSTRKPFKVLREGSVGVDSNLLY